ncbi:hypothetical protein ACFZAU_36680 [Streptomyces sp. NPDC008238]
MAVAEQVNLPTAQHNRRRAGVPQLRRIGRSAAVNNVASPSR